MEENIDTHTFLTISNDKLIIKKDYTRESDDFYKWIAAVLGFLLAIFIIPRIISLEALIVLFCLTSCFLPIICIYSYYRYRKYDWIFDTSLKKIRLQRVSPSFKKNRSYDFSNIDSITYLLGNYVYSPSQYDVKFFLKNKKKGKKVYIGNKEKCERVANLVSEFIEKPCIYDDFKEAKTYWDYNSIVLPNTKTALKEDAKIEGNVIFVDIRHRKKFIIDTTLALRKAREKCHYAVLRFFSQNNQEFMIITSKPNQNVAKRIGLTSKQTHRIRLLNPKLTNNQIVELLK